MKSRMGSALTVGRFTSWLFSPNREAEDPNRIWIQLHASCKVNGEDIGVVVQCHGPVLPDDQTARAKILAATPLLVTYAPPDDFRLGKEHH